MKSSGTERCSNTHLLLNQTPGLRWQISETFASDSIQQLKTANNTSKSNKVICIPESEQRTIEGTVGYLCKNELERTQGFELASGGFGGLFKEAKFVLTDALRKGTLL